MRAALFISALLLAACGAEAPVEAPGSEPPSAARRAPERGGLRPAAARALRERAHWYDGTRKRAIWVNRRRIVDLETGDRTRSLLKNEAPDAALVSVGPRTRVWRLTREGADARELAKALRRADPECRFAPAFHDAPSDDALMRVPTGRIVVRFPPDWSEDRVEDWARREGLPVVERLSLMGVVRVLDAGEGLAALERANAIHESGTVVWASPEWWKPLSRR